MRKLITILALLSCNAHAEFLDGNKLYERLTSSKLTDYASALGYIMGVADTMHDITHCAPANATSGQMGDMVKLFLEQQPSARTKSGDVIVNHVLKSTWPCKRS